MNVVTSLRQLLFPCNHNSLDFCLWDYSCLPNTLWVIKNIRFLTSCCFEFIGHHIHPVQSWTPTCFLVAWEKEEEVLSWNKKWHTVKRFTYIFSPFFSSPSCSGPACSGPTCSSPKVFHLFLVTGGCEPPCSCWELNSWPPEEQSVLLTIEPSHQPQFIYTFTAQFLITFTFTFTEVNV
jgi:hypothetical protein